MGVGKRRLILLFVVVLVIVMIRLPKVDAAVDEYLYVHTDDNTNTDWIEVGTTPWVDLQDEPTNEGWVASSNQLWGNFLIDDTTGTGAVNSISLDVYCDSGTEKIQFYVYDLSVTQFVLAGTDDSSSGYHSNSFDLSSIITTVAEIDAIEVYAKSKNNGGFGGNVRVDYIVVHVNVEVVSGTDYTAYPSGNLALGGTTSLSASFSKTLIEGFVLAGVTVLSAAFAVTLIQGFTLVGGTALAGIYSKTLIEGFALTGGVSLAAGFVVTLVQGLTLVGTTSVLVIIQILIVEGFALTGGVSLVAGFVVTLVQGIVLGGTTALAAAFVVTLVQGFSLGGTVALAVSYVKTLVEGFSLSGTVSAFKVFLVNLQESFTFGVGANITKIAGVSLIGSIFFQLFLGVNMWGYLGPMALVVGGYFAMKKDRSLGVIWFVVECVVMAQYFALVEATPDYWWNIFIIMFGSLFTIAFPLWGGRK